MTWAVSVKAPTRNGLVLQHDHDGFLSPDDALAWVARNYDFLWAERVEIALVPSPEVEA